MLVSSQLNNGAVLMIYDVSIVRLWGEKSHTDRSSESYYDTRRELDCRWEVNSPPPRSELLRVVGILETDSNDGKGLRC